MRIMGMEVFGVLEEGGILDRYPWFREFATAFIQKRLRHIGML